MRKKIVAGNWKMNKTFNEAEDLLFGIADALEKGRPDDVEVIVCPPSLYLELANDVATEHNFKCGAQNMSEQESGAFTGEISAGMLDSINVDYVILGHSERRTYFGETDEVIGKKVQQAIRHNLNPIYCCGEVLEEREAGKYFEVVENQITRALSGLSADDFSKVVIAYEPVWAIGTGRTATAEQAQEMHAFIRKVLTSLFNEEAAGNTTILYGGSCNSGNARELFANPDVDGGLIGGASLKAEEFVKIVNSF